MSEIQSKAATQEFRENWERIFGSREADETSVEAAPSDTTIGKASLFEPPETAEAFAERQCDSERASWLSSVRERDAQWRAVLDAVFLDGWSLGLTARDGCLVKSYQIGEQPEHEIPCSREMSFALAVRVLAQQQKEVLASYGGWPAAEDFSEARAAFEESVHTKKDGA